jgi:hypothetical protein
MSKAKKYSYLCNDNQDFKCPEKKWQRAKPLFVNKISFDFESRTMNLKDVKEILDDLCIPFFFTHGVLLGAVREGDYIKHDDDIDLDIFEEILIEHYDEICERLIDKGFIVRGRNIKHKMKRGEKINIYRHKEKMNIRGIYSDPNYEQDKYRLTNVFQYLRKFHDNPESIIFKGMEFMAPGPISEFLVYCFGEEWKTPVFKTKEEKKKGRVRGVRRPGK